MIKIICYMNGSKNSICAVEICPSKIGQFKRDTDCRIINKNGNFFAIL
jgi:hypothetical protein